MDVILHIGAHRTASTSFQAYLRDNDAALTRQGVGAWGPRRTRGGLFAGIWPEAEVLPRRDGPARAAGRIALALHAEVAQGRRSLIVSDENVIGPPRDGIRACMLYPAAGERIARLAAAFEGRICRAVLSIRSPDAYWTSLVAMTVARGRPLPGPHRLQGLAHSPRRWRDVITDIACALPDVPLLVMPHEVFGAVPERRLAAMLPTPVDAPRLHARRCLNAAPKLPQLRAALALAGRDTTHLPTGDGAYMPFTRAQTARLQESYADDLFWLHAGADGLATLITGKSSGAEGKTPTPDPTERGHDDGQQGRVAQAG
ncbi:hypothetical protein [Lacimonas salitolerans]|uniref:Sulfotransferase family protein n=1 Tax=Lacimonas salitolerans TaxID=1323750 RepID=A0ABW4EC33_9RHOB